MTPSQKVSQRPPEYAMWATMNSRCHNPKSISYKNYGGCGIRVCDEWIGRGGFKRFISDIGHRPVGNYTIERLDNKGNYEPGNCVWATTKQQSRNTSRNRVLEFNGKKQCLADWALELGMSVPTLFNRIVYRKWPIEVALTRGVGDDKWHKRRIDTEKNP